MFDAHQKGNGTISELIFSVMPPQFGIKINESFIYQTETARHVIVDGVTKLIAVRLHMVLQ